MAGVGKTALAVSVGHYIAERRSMVQFLDGVFFVSMHDIANVETAFQKLISILSSSPLLQGVYLFVHNLVSEEFYFSFIWKIQMFCFFLFSIYLFVASSSLFFYLKKFRFLPSFVLQVIK